MFVDHLFADVWKGRTDTEEIEEFSTRMHQKVRPIEDGPHGVVFIGFCSDEGVSRNKGRKGAAKGPDQLRRAMANLPWAADYDLYDAGNIICESGALETAQLYLAEKVKHCLQDGHFPVVLGGGHEVAFGSWLGFAQYFTSQMSASKVGIINFDAHFDLRKDTYGCNSGTSFYQIAHVCRENNYPFKYCCLGVSDISNTLALFKRADELGVSYRLDTDMTRDHFEACQQQLAQFIAGCDLLYLTIDLDVLPAYVAPGVSAPAALGVGLDVIEPLIEMIKQSGKLRLADIAEYNPDYDIDNRTARVAARLIHRIAR